MQPADFTKDSRGRLVPTIGGHRAFVPDDLPPKIVWTGELVSAVSAADRALGRLAGLGQDMPNPHLLIRPFLRREAVLSSRIEGTQASMPQLLLFEVDEAIEQRVPDVREVANYVRALEYGLGRRQQLPLSLRLIREMHGLLLEGVRNRQWTTCPGPRSSRRSTRPLPPGTGRSCPCGNLSHVQRILRGG